MTATARKISPPSPPEPSPEIVRARDIMMPDPFTLDGEMRVIDAAELMIAHGVSNAPVVYADFSRKMLVEGASLQCTHCGIAAELTQEFEDVTGKTRWIPVDPMADYDEELDR